MTGFDFRETRTGSLWIAHHPDLGVEQVVDAIDAHRRNHTRGRSACEKWGPGSSVSRVEIRGPGGANGPVVAVKWNRWRGVCGMISDRLRGSRARRALAGAAQIGAVGVTTPEPLAVAERIRGGFVLESYLLTRFAADAEPLPALLPELASNRRRRQTALGSLGELIGTLHASGIDHSDLKPSNLLLGSGSRLSILDLDSLRLRRPLPMRNRVRALAQLEAYAQELAPWLSRSDRAHFWKAYVERDPSLRSGARELFEKVEGAARRRLERESVKSTEGRFFPMAPRGSGAPSGEAGERRRIALVHPRASRTGGVEGQIHELAKRLVAAGWEVTYFCQRRTAGLDPGIRFHIVPNRARPVRFLKVWLFARDSRRAIEKLGPFELVCGFGKTSHHDVYRDGSGCLADYQTYSLSVISPPLRRWLRRHGLHQRVVAGIERARYRPGNTRRVLAISQRVRSQILERYDLESERVEVLYPGVDTRRFHPDRGDGIALRSEFGIPTAAPVLIFIGSDFRRKGLDRLIAALEWLPEAHAIVLGRDPSKRESAARSAVASRGLVSRVHLLGHRPDPERFLAGGDVFVFPSRFDAFGNAVLEAMACGLPVVVSRLAGAAELVEMAEAGTVVDTPEDSEALAAAIRCCLDPAVGAAAGRRARRVAEEHSWERHFARILEIYSELDRR